MTDEERLKKAYFTAKQKVIRGGNNSVGVPTITMVEGAYDELFNQMGRAIEVAKENQELKRNLTVTNQSWKELMHQNEKYRAALEQLRQNIINSPVYREEDGSPITNETDEYIYHLTTQALEDECQTCNGTGTVEVAEEFMYNGQPVEGITYFACDKCNGSGQS